MIEKAYCINLDRRPEKWEQTKLQMEKFGIEAERFSAIDGQLLNLNTDARKKAEIACSFSHLNLLKRANQEIKDNVLIVEDDVIFKDRAREFFDQRFPLIPANWDIIFLGANHAHGFSQVNEFIVKCLGSASLHACLYSKSGLPKILDYLDKEYPSMNENNVVLDVILARAHHNLLNVYCFMPHLVYQREGFSDIAQDYVNYDFLK